MPEIASTGSIPALLNPDAGTAGAARKALEAAGGFEIEATDAKTLEQRVRELARAGNRRILVAGGDGTIGSAAAILCKTGVELAILPGGTLNHFARDHKIPTDPKEAVSAALTSSALPVDVGYLGDRPFLNTCSVGMYVGYVLTRERLEKYLGYRISSFIATIRTFFRFWTATVEVEADGKTKTYEAALVFIAVGERETKAPDFGSRTDGGRRGLHVIVVQSPRKARLLALALAAASRGVEAASHGEDLDSFVVDRCTIRMRRRSTRIALDGEITRAAIPLELRVERDALNVVGAACP